jgi:hypothetical protein
MYITSQSRSEIAKYLSHIDPVRSGETWPKLSWKNVALKQSQTLLQPRYTSLHFNNIFISGNTLNSTSHTLDSAQHGILESRDLGHLGIIPGLSSSGSNSQRFATVASFEDIRRAVR